MNPASELVQTTTNLHIRSGRGGSNKSLAVVQANVILWPTEKTPVNSWLERFLVGWRKDKTLYSESDERASVKAINLNGDFHVYESENGFDRVQVSGYCWIGNPNSPTYKEVKSNVD